MQYTLLIYETPADFAERDAAEESQYFAAWRAYYRALVEAGIYVGGNPLDAPETATTVRLRGGQRQVQDGPHASSKEQLGGFIVLELPTLDVALQWAARCPAAAHAAVEVRPIAPEVHQRVTRERP